MTNQPRKYFSVRARVSQIEGLKFWVTPLSSADDLCSSCASFGQCRAQFFRFLPMSPSSPFFFLPRENFCRVGDIVLLSFPHSSFLFRLCFIFLIPTFFFVMTGMITEAMAWRESSVFLLSWLSLFISGMATRSFFRWRFFDMSRDVVVSRCENSSAQESRSCSY